MMTRRFVAASALVTVLLTTGCARSADSDTPDSPGAPPASTAPSLPADSQSSAPVGQTITGTVAAGVEPNCLLLSGRAGNHLLIFADPELRKQAKVGEEITVIGRPDPAQITTCQEGTPFTVTAVRPN